MIVSACCALVIIPRVESLTRDSAAGLQSGVQEDLDGIEQTASQNIDKLDRTLRELVKSDNEAWSTDFDKLEKSMDEGLSRTERQLKEDRAAIAALLKVRIRSP